MNDVPPSRRPISPSQTGSPRDFTSRNGRSISETERADRVSARAERPRDETPRAERLLDETPRAERLRDESPRAERFRDENQRAVATPAASSASDPRTSVTVNAEREQSAEDEMLRRRLARQNRRTDEALAALTEMMQSSEARRLQERDAVAKLTEKMSNLEHSLSERLGANEQPIRGALARLEARLDLMGKRSAIEVDEQRATRNEGDSVRRLEDKLNSIMDAMKLAPAPRAQASELAMEAAGRRPSSPMLRSMKDTIEEIASRQQVLDERDEARQRRPADGTVGIAQAQAPTVAQSRPALPAAAPAQDAAPRSLYRIMPKSAASALEGSFRKLGVRAEQRAPERGVDLAFATLPAESIRTGNPATSGEPAIAAFEERLNKLASKVDDALAKLAAVPAPAPDTSKATAALEGVVRDLSAKIEAMASPKDEAHLDHLHKQVEMLTTRFDRSAESLSALPTLAQSVRELFNQVEATRNNIEAAAQKAAREAMRIAIDEGRVRAPGAEAANSLIKGIVKDAGTGEAAAAADRKALNAVHKMLDDVVGRLSSLERAAVAPQTAAPATDTALLGGVQRDKAGTASSADRSGGSRTAKRDSDDQQRAEFIAAARRAASSARAEAGLTQASADGPAHERGRTRLFATGRHHLANHKKSVVMGIAAILVVLGTITLIQRVGTVATGDATVKQAELASPVAHPSDAAESASKNDDAVNATPAASMVAPLPRSAALVTVPSGDTDKTQTASIASIPAFAAINNGGSRSSAPSLPPGLRAAAEAGDAAAQYELGTMYAEGRAIPRDPKNAAAWLEKAADQGSIPAKYRLATMFEKGVGVSPDKARAKALYLAAAEGGNPRAMHNLAVLLADGDGHPDYAGAAGWFRRAAAYGIHDSQYNLAILLARGLGVTQSLVQSYQWFAVAAAQDDADAARKRDEVGSKLSSNELTVAKAFAASFKPKTPPASAVEVAMPAGGWTGTAGAAHVNNGRKVSS